MTDELEEVQEALELLKGDAVVQFEAPARVIVETEQGEYEEAETLGWVKFSAAFRKRMLKNLKGAKLGVFLCICLHVNENGTSFPSVDLIAEETGYDRDTVMLAISEMEQMEGLLTVLRSQGRKNIYRPMFVARGAKEPTSRKIRPVGKSDQTSPEKLDSTSPENLDSKKKESKKKGDALDLLLKTQRPNEKAEAEATNAFEVAFGFDKLPWWSAGRTWDAFRKFVVQEYQADPGAFPAYVEWRNDKNGGMFKAMSNVAIRKNPQMFIDTSWAEFRVVRVATSARPAAERKIHRAPADANQPRELPDFVIAKQQEIYARGGGLKQ